MTDTERLDKLETFLNNLVDSNGIAIMPLTLLGDRLFSIDDICNEDGSNFGEVFSEGANIRDLIDNLQPQAEDDV